MNYERYQPTPDVNVPGAPPAYKSTQQRYAEQLAQAQAVDARNQAMYSQAQAERQAKIDAERAKEMANPESHYRMEQVTYAANSDPEGAPVVQETPEMRQVWGGPMDEGTYRKSYDAQQAIFKTPAIAAPQASFVQQPSALAPATAPQWPSAQPPVMPGSPPLARPPVMPTARPMPAGPAQTSPLQKEVIPSRPPPLPGATWGGWQGASQAQPSRPISPQVAPMRATPAPMQRPGAAPSARKMWGQ